MVTVEPWIPALYSNEKDRVLLLSDALLNDKIMDACNTLVARHIGKDNSESTLLVQKIFQKFF